MRTTKSSNAASGNPLGRKFFAHTEPHSEPSFSFPVKTSQDKLIIKVVKGRKTEYEGRFLVTKQMLSGFAASLNSLRRQGGKVKATIYLEEN